MSFIDLIKLVISEFGVKEILLFLLGIVLLGEFCLCIQEFIEAVTTGR